MIPNLLIQAALIIIAVRCGYVAFQMLNRRQKPWLDIAFYISVVVVALSWLL